MSTAEDTVPGTGQGSEPETDAKAAAKARRLANLRPPFRKGQSGNPRGYNGRGKANEIAAFLDKPESIESNRTRFEAIVDRLYLAARRGDTLAAKLLIEYKLGKPRTTPNALELAEHLRRVERNRVDIAFSVIGAERLHTMEQEKLAEIMRACERDTRWFLEAAEQFANGEQPVEAQDEAALAGEVKQPKVAPAEQSSADEAPGAEP